MSWLLIDHVSVFFLFVIMLICAPSAVYSLGYLKGAYPPARIMLSRALFIVFVLSMALVVTVGNAFVFLIVWEIMSLVSYFLVIFDTTHEKSIKAGMIYIIMTHIGTAFLSAAFLLLYSFSGSFDFPAMQAGCRLMSPQMKNIIFLLFLVGFGTKAGIVPLHVWLPYAHPQAPSHISSIMSGVMIKTAIYGIIRFVICLLGPGPAWWGVIVLMLALVSCLSGVIYALMEHDIKKLLAYHSVENIGIILLGVGLTMLFLSKGMPYAAVFSLIAGLYHLVNHAIFKGLLFLCAGSVYKATGTRDIEKLGGLIKKMPFTAIYFLIGAMAISALPPLNGFVSEWLTLQAFFLGATGLEGGMRLFMIICAAILALTSGLAAACFVKAFGITFLASARSRHARNAAESPFSMQAGMFFLSGMAVIFGLAAVPVMRFLVQVASAATLIDAGGMSFSLNSLIVSPQGPGESYLSTPLLASAFLVLGLIVILAYHILRKERVVAYRTWDCGYYSLNARTEYTATAFSKPFRIAFAFFLLPYRKTQKIRGSFYHVTSFIYETHTTMVFKKYLYEPALALVFKSAKSLRKIQPGSIHVYVLYIFAAAALLIIFRERF